MNVIESIKGRSSLFYCCIHQLFPGCFISELGYKVRTYTSNGISHGSICSSNMERDLRGWQRFYWEIKFRRLMLQVSVLALEQLTALLTTRIFPMKRVITNVCSCNKASPHAPLQTSLVLVSCSEDKTQGAVPVKSVFLQTAPRAVCVCSDLSSGLCLV